MKNGRNIGFSNWQQTINFREKKADLLFAFGSYGLDKSQLFPVR